LELGIGVHIHLAESAEMFKELEKRYGCSEVEFLHRLGFFKGHVLAAHCINLSESDRRILAEHGVNVVHVPVANMKLGLALRKLRSSLTWALTWLWALMVRQATIRLTCLKP
jgi:cytosine/adenosine deaminase-related metal-dependent hydrolase